MWMKEDHMGNGQLKPAYNLQVSSNNQYILNYSFHQTTADTTILQQHTELYKTQYASHPDVITADAEYGSEENYEYLQQTNIENYVKYSYFIRSKAVEQIKNILLKHTRRFTMKTKIVTIALWASR